MAAKLYKFDLNCGRAGSLRGLFVADEETEIKPAIGLEICFGEVLGKHSEVIFDLEEGHLTALTDDADFIAKFEAYECASGYNPLAYITCPECDDTLEAPYVECECSWVKEEEA